MSCYEVWLIHRWRLFCWRWRVQCDPILMFLLFREPDLVSSLCWYFTNASPSKSQWCPIDSISVCEWVIEFCHRHREYEYFTFPWLHPALIAWWCLLLQLSTCHTHPGVRQCDTQQLWIRASTNPAWCYLLPHDSFIGLSDRLVLPSCWPTAKDHRMWCKMQSIH